MLHVYKFKFPCICGHFILCCGPVNIYAGNEPSTCHFILKKKKKNLWIIPPIVLMFFRTSLSLNHTATCGRKVHTEGGGGIYLCIRRKMIYFNVKSLQGHHCSLFSFSFILSQIFLRYKRLQKT